MGRRGAKMGKSSTTTVKVAVVDAEPEQQPLLVSFPLGPPRELTIGRPQDLQVHNFLGRKSNGAVKRHTVVRGNKMEFIGKQSSSVANGCKYLLGVLNKQTNKLEIIQPGPVLALRGELIGDSAKAKAAHEAQKKERE